MPSPKFLLLLMLVFPALANAKDPSDAELNDWMTYVKSVGLPATVEMCSAVLKDEGQLKAAGDQWLEAKKDAIARGKAVAESSPPKNGMSVEEWNRGLVEDFRVKFAKQPDEFKLDWCQKYGDSLNSESR
jgi:hypothetical protein